MASRRSEQALEIRIAADRAMEYDDIRALDLVGRRGDVEKPTVDPICHARRREQVSGAWLVALGVGSLALGVAEPMPL